VRPIAPGTSDRRICVQQRPWPLTPAGVRRQWVGGRGPPGERGGTANPGRTKTAATAGRRCGKAAGRSAVRRRGEGAPGAAGAGVLWPAKMAGRRAVGEEAGRRAVEDSRAARSGNYTAAPAAGQPAVSVVAGRGGGPPRRRHSTADPAAGQPAFSFVTASGRGPPRRPCEVGWQGRRGGGGGGSGYSRRRRARRTARVRAALRARSSPTSPPT
jgi:hypothetical protein